MVVSILVEISDFTRGWQKTRLDDTPTPLSLSYSTILGWTTDVNFKDIISS